MTFLPLKLWMLHQFKIGLVLVSWNFKICHFMKKVSFASTYGILTQSTEWPNKLQCTRWQFLPICHRNLVLWHIFIHSVMFQCKNFIIHTKNKNFLSSSQLFHVFIITAFLLAFKKFFNLFFLTVFFWNITGITIKTVCFMVLLNQMAWIEVINHTSLDPII